MTSPVEVHAIRKHLARFIVHALLLGVVISTQSRSAAANEAHVDLDFGFFHVWYAVDQATRFAFKEKMTQWRNCVTGKTTSVPSPLTVGKKSSRVQAPEGSPRWSGTHDERHPLLAGCVTRVVQGLLKPREDGRFFIPDLTPRRLASRLARKVAGEVRIERTGVHRTRVSLRTDDPKKADFAVAWLEYLRTALSDGPATRSHLTEQSYSVTGDFDLNDELVSAAVWLPCAILKTRHRSAQPPSSSQTRTGVFRRRAEWLLDMDVQKARDAVTAAATDPANPSDCSKAYRDIALSQEIPAATLAQRVQSQVDNKTSSKDLERFIAFIQALPPEIRTHLGDEGKWDILLTAALTREEEARRRKRAKEDEQLASMGPHQRICEEIRLGRRGPSIDQYKATKMPSQHAGSAARWPVATHIIIKELSPNTYLMGTADQLWVMAVPADLKMDLDDAFSARGMLSTEKLMNAFGGTSIVPRLDVACFL